MENISWLCQDAKPTAEEVYNEFLRQATKLIHYKNSGIWVEFQKEERLEQMT